MTISVTLTPTNQDVTIYWNTDFLVNNTVAAYLATTIAGLADPAQRMTGIPANANALPDTTFQVTVPNLAGGQAPLNGLNQYFIQVQCDAQMSAVQSTVTLPNNPNTVHLHQPEADPKKINANGGRSTVSVTVRQDSNTIGGIPVTFTAPAGCGGSLGPVGGDGAGSTFLIKSDGNGLAEADFIAGNTKGSYDIDISAAGYAANSQSATVTIQ